MFNVIKTTLNNQSKANAFVFKSYMFRSRYRPSSG